MGCGASVEGESDSQASEEEEEEDIDKRRRRNADRLRDPNHQRIRGRPGSRRRRSSGSYNSEEEGSTQEEDEDDRRSRPNEDRRTRNQNQYTRNGYGPERNVAIVSDLVPAYQTGAGAALDTESNLPNSTEYDKKFFVDSSFLPSESSLYHTQKQIMDNKIVWMRPHELASEPELFVDGTCRHDIVQGILADCWFLSSCAAVAQRPDLMDQVIPPNQRLFGDEYSGRLTFQFWRFGRWVAVHIDDLLPTRKRKLIYCRSSSPSEFWVSLLEKAYAKVHGSYEALEGGQSMDALVDLTGGLAERYEIETAPSHLYDYLLQASASGAFITCSRKGDWRMSYHTDLNGLISGHAYTISAVATVKLSTGSEAFLLRIRNPWGNDTEWSGQWNDSDDSWKKVDSGVRHSMGLTEKGDGEFWMSFQDFSREFEEVTICSLKPDLKGTGARSDVGPNAIIATESRTITGRWELGKTAGGSRNNLVKFATNPQILLNVAQPEKRLFDRERDMPLCHVVVSLMQLRRRCVRHPGRKMLQIGFVLYKIPEPVKQTVENLVHGREVGNSAPYINYREVFGRFELLPGMYMIVPATFEPNAPGSFLIRVFADTKVNLREV